MPISLTHGLLVALALVGIALPARTGHGTDVPSLHRIGVLMPPVARSSIEEGVRQGLRELGYVEGKNLIIEWQRSAGADEELRRLAAERLVSTPR